MDENKQQQFKLTSAVGGGDDEYGEYELIPLSMVKGGKLEPFKVHTKPLRHIINGSSPTPRGWYKDKHEQPNRRPRPCYTEALLTTPYGGFCPVGCKFCYVDHGTRGYRSTGLPTVNPGYPDAMRKQVAQLQVSGAAYISSFTEPFHHLENTHNVTQRLSQVFVDEGLPIFYLTRRSVPQWAIDNLLQNPYSYMQWSINTSSPSVYRHLSPGAIKLDKWLEEVENMHRQGIFVSIQCNPILPGIVDLYDIKNLVEVGAQAGVNHFIFKFAEQVYNNRKMLLDRLANVPGVDEFERMLNQTIGGVYTIQQDVRLEWLTELLTTTRANGVTMSTCYEYYDDGGAGANLAPYVTTSDQCHGRGIPVYYRPEPGAPFQPLPGCYRKGCLYCEEYGTHACGNEKLMEASALEYKDLRGIQLVGDYRNWHLEDSCARPESVHRPEYGHNPEFWTDAEMWGWEQE